MMTSGMAAVGLKWRWESAELHVSDRETLRSLLNSRGGGITTAVSFSSSSLKGLTTSPGVEIKLESASIEIKRESSIDIMYIYTGTIQKN